MNEPKPTESSPLPGDSADFSLLIGGPLFQLLRRAHLSDDALGLVRLRIVVMCLLAWLPLLVLSALEGQLWGGIARAFDSRPLRTSLAALAVLLFLGTLVELTTLPVCHE